MIASHSAKLTKRFEPIVESLITAIKEATGGAVELDAIFKGFEQANPTLIAKASSGTEFFITGGVHLYIDSKPFEGYAANLKVAHELGISVAPDLLFESRKSDCSVLAVQYPDCPKNPPVHIDMVANIPFPALQQRHQAIVSLAQAGWIHPLAPNGHQVLTENGKICFTNWECMRRITPEEKAAIFVEAQALINDLHIPRSFCINGEQFKSSSGLMNAVKYPPGYEKRMRARNSEISAKVEFDIHQHQIHLFGKVLSPLSNEWNLVVQIVKNVCSPKIAPVNIVSSSRRFGICSNFAVSPFSLESSDPRDAKRFKSVEAFLQYIKYPHGHPFKLEIPNTSAVEAKEYGRGANTFNDQILAAGGTPKIYWNNEEIDFRSERHLDLAYQAVLAKFSQNSDALWTLLGTTGLALVHNTGRSDSPITSLKSVELAEMLMKVRDLKIHELWPNFSITLPVDLASTTFTVSLSS